MDTLKKGIALFIALLLAFPLSAGALTAKYESLFGEGEILLIDFEVDDALWQRMLSNAMDKEVICCNMTVNGKRYASVGVNVRGNTSLAGVENGRYSLRVTFDEYVHQQSLQGLDKLLLNNLYGDPTYMKEYLAYSLFRRMGVPSPLCAFAHVTVNGQDYGFMLAVEAMETDFEARAFSTEKGFLYKVETVGINGLGLDRRIIPQERQRRGARDGFWQDFSDRARPTVPTVTSSPESGEPSPHPDRPEQGRPGFFGDLNGADLAYRGESADLYSAIFNGAEESYTPRDAARVIAALKALSAGSEEEVFTAFDTSEIAAYFAVNTLIVNTDQYAGPLAHNYYLYEQNGRLSLLPWDYNAAFGGFLGNDAEDFIRFPIDSPTDPLPLEERPLLQRLFASEAWKSSYHDALSRALSFVENGAFASRVSAVKALIAPYIQQETNPFYDYQQFEQASDALVTLFEMRMENVRSQLDGSEAPGTAEPLPSLGVLSGMERSEEARPEEQQAAPAAEPPREPKEPEPADDSLPLPPPAPNASAQNTWVIAIALLIVLLVVGLGMILFKRK